MIERPGILYAREPSLDTAEFRRVLVESDLAAIRPVDDEARLSAMLANAGLIVTARRASASRELVGVARGLTDSAWCCYLSEIAVCASAQGLGVGRGLLDEARRRLGPEVSLFLASVPAAVGFYERVGMARVPDVFLFRRAR
ncbi:GNAT family N-acetyltransferase [Marinivivus vitaminiproducens]|uniref:GNAT family N-acetyltransferase n=1 Tax=Marinivivus vitaminiproducens TaxID=3035935 RepID=UPI00279C7724|nr:GNAT family N-acetyltransferase [Geminicoccaceae bacterium SCSIO 64248]